MKHDDDEFADKRGLARNDHPDTSHEAADAIMPKSGTQRRRVYDFIQGCGPQGATDLEQQRILGLVGNTQRPRRRELVTAGLVVDSGRRRQHGGRGMIVWIAP